MSWQAKPLIIRLKTFVSMYPYKMIQSFPTSKQEQQRKPVLFNGLCSIYSTLSTTWIPCTEINNTNKTMLPDEPSSFGNIVTASCYKHCCVLHSLFPSMFFVFVEWGPKTGNVSSKCVVCFLHFSIQPSLLTRLTFWEKKGSIWDNRGVGGEGVYTAHWSQYQALYTHCTLSQNTVMLEIRMAFHANRGTCCAGDRLVLQTKL